MHYEMGVRDCCPDKNYFFFLLLFNYTVLLDSCLQQCFEIINLYLDLQEGSISAVENFIKIF